MSVEWNEDPGLRPTAAMSRWIAAELDPFDGSDVRDLRNRLWSDVAVQRFVDVAAVAAESAALPEREHLTLFRDAAAAWSSAGVAVDDVLDYLFALTRAVAARVDHVGAGRVERVGERVVTEVCRVYVACAEDRFDTREYDRSELTRLMLRDPARALEFARSTGASISVRYDVVAVAVRAVGTSVDAADVRRALALLGERARDLVPGAMTALSATGGTVLVPAVENGSDRAREIVEGAQLPPEIALVGVRARARREDVPDTVAFVGEILDIASSLGRPAGLYEDGEFVMHYQLARPGRGREACAELIEPITDNTDLVETLRMFILSETSRTACARALFVHPNTVDYRLKKIAHLTGADPTSTEGLTKLNAALIATDNF